MHRVHTCVWAKTANVWIPATCKPIRAINGQVRKVDGDGRDVLRRLRHACRHAGVVSQGAPIGFSVPALKTNEQAKREPALPDFQTGTAPRPLALVGTADNERMWPVQDLQRMACGLQQRRLAAA